MMAMNVWLRASRRGGATIYDELQRHLQTKHLPLRHIQFATHGAILTDFAVHLDSPVFTQRIAAYIVHCLVEAESVALPEPLAKRGDASGVLTLADCKAALPMDLQRPVGDAMKAISAHVRRHEPTSPKDALCPLGSGRDKSEEDAGEEASIEAKALGHKAMLLLWALGHCAKSGGEKLLARLCASAIAFDKHRGGVYFNRGTKLEYDVYEAVHGAIGKPASLLADTLVKLSCMYEAFEAISHADEQRLSSGGREWLLKPQPDSEAGKDAAARQERFVSHLIYHVNVLAGYHEARACRNDAMAVWGVEGQTISSTVISDLAAQQLLPCMPLFKAQKSELTWGACPRANAHDLLSVASSRAEASGNAVGAVLRYAREGGRTNASAARPSEATLRDYDLHVRHMLLAYLVSLMTATAVRGSQTVTALLVAVFGANADDTAIAEGCIPGGVSFGDLLGTSGDIILNWAQVAPRLCAKDARASSFDPLGLHGRSSHSAKKNNAQRGGPTSLRVQDHTTVKHVVGREWGWAMALGNQAMYITYLVQLYNVAVDAGAYTKRTVEKELQSLQRRGVGNVLAETLAIVDARNTHGVTCVGFISTSTAGQHVDLTGSRVRVVKAYHPSLRRDVNKLDLRPVAVTEDRVRADQYANSTAFTYASGGDGRHRVAVVPTKMTGRCARVNHSTQDDRGADVQTRNRDADCKQRNHSDAVEGKHYKGAARSASYVANDGTVACQFGDGHGQVCVTTKECVHCHDLLTEGDCSACVCVRTARQHAMEAGLAAADGEGWDIRRPADARAAFGDSSVAERCEALAAVGESLLGYLLTPSPLPSHPSWGRAPKTPQEIYGTLTTPGAMLGMLHAQSAQAYIERLRRAIGLAPSGADAERAAALVCGANTPSLLAQRQVAPGGWMRGLHQPMPHSLHQQLQTERTAGATVTVLGADAVELEAMRRALLRAEERAERTQAELDVAREVAREESTTVAGGIKVVMRDALADALADAMIARGGAQVGSRAAARVAQARGEQAACARTLVDPAQREGVARALVSSVKDIAAGALAAVEDPAAARAARELIAAAQAAAVQTLAMPVGSSATRSIVDAQGAQRALALGRRAAADAMGVPLEEVQPVAVQARAAPPSGVTQAARAAQAAIGAFAEQARQSCPPELVPMVVDPAVGILGQHLDQLAAMVASMAPPPVPPVPPVMPAPSVPPSSALSVEDAAMASTQCIAAPCAVAAPSSTGGAGSSGVQVASCSGVSSTTTKKRNGANAECGDVVTGKRVRRPSAKKRSEADS